MSPGLRRSVQGHVGIDLFFVSPLCISTLLPRVTGLFWGWGRGFRRSRLLSGHPNPKGGTVISQHQLLAPHPGKPGWSQPPIFPTSNTSHHLSIPHSPGANGKVPHLTSGTGGWNAASLPGADGRAPVPDHCLHEIFLCLCLTLADLLINS